MAFLGLFGKKKEAAVSEEDKILDGAESPEVVVPDHAKAIEEKAEEVKEKVSTKKAVFRVNGVYEMGKEMMFSGIVESGKIKWKMKLKDGNKEGTITDIKAGSTSVDEILPKEEGKIFVKGKGLIMIKYDDLLEFK